MLRPLCPSPRCGPVLAALLVVLSFSVASGIASAADSESAVITKARWGKTPRGETRVVFQLDRPAAYRVEATHDGQAIEVRLINTVPSPAVTLMKIWDGRVDKVSFRPAPNGTVAHIDGMGKPLHVRSFALSSPTRIVVDLSVEDGAPASQPTLAEPAPSRKSAPSGIGTSAGDANAPSPPPSGEQPPVEPATPSVFERVASKASSSGSDEEGFENLMSWLRVLKTKVDALNLSETEEERAKYRRSLAYFLAQRGIYREAEKALVAALESESRDRRTVREDSLYLAELRLENGDSEGASAIARNFPTEQATPTEKLRLAKVLSTCGLPQVAQSVLEPVLFELEGEQHSDALLLLARCHWDQQEPAKSLSFVQRLTSSPDTPERALSDALILNADCLWALGRPLDAKGFYEKAAKRELSPEEGSWVTLQLGNVARREGRIDDAKRHYRSAVEKWPGTFFASQADWFLRIADETQAVEQAEVLRDRG